MKAKNLDKKFDNAAATIGVTRQAVIKIWLAERLKIEAA
jgi:hypothetical protein